MSARDPAALSTPLLDLSVLELLASRICHDLISPVGAVHNGVEFLEETGIEDGAEAIALIAHSAQSAAARLQVFRLAYGAGGRDPNLTAEDVHKAFASLLETDHKIAQEWDPHTFPGRNATPPGLCKMLAGTMILALECLPKGGTIHVTAAAPDRTEIAAEGPETLLREGVEDALALALPVSDLDPRLIHPYVAALLARHYGFALTLAEKSPARIVMVLEGPRGAG